MSTLTITVKKPGYLEWTNQYAGWKKSATHSEVVVLNYDNQTNLSLQSAICKNRQDEHDVTKSAMKLNCGPSSKTVIDLSRGTFTLTCVARVP